MHPPLGETKNARGVAFAPIGTVAICFFALGLLVNDAVAQDYLTANSQLDNSQLIEMPTARMEPDGQLSASFEYLRNNQRYDLGFQALPWLQMHFQYAGLSHFDPAFPVYWDRSFGFKARLWNETALLPAVALGADDLIGTGIFSGEYLVASKEFGNIDASFGMGWGIYGSTNLFRNPLTYIFNSLNNRPAGAPAGATDFGLLFHGRDVGLFGGAAWHTPVTGLSLVAEYSSNTYQRERASGNLTPKSQLNYAIQYDVNNTTSLSLGWVYDTTLEGSVLFSFDPVHPQYPQKFEPPAPPVAVRTDEQRQQALIALEALRDPSSGQRIQQFQSRNADRNSFVDSIWKEGSDYADIRVQQRSLDITTNGTVSSNRCINIARLIQGVEIDINQIKLHSPDNHRSTTCSVPNTVKSAPISAAFLSEGDLQPSIVPLAQTQSIDATAAPFEADRAQIERTIRAAIVAQHIFVEALKLGRGELVLYYSNRHYLAETDAIDRIVRVLTKEAPPDIEKFRLIAVTGGVPVQEFDVLRAPVERSYEQEDENIFDHSITVASPGLNQPVLTEAEKENYPRFSWNIYPQFRQELFDPSQPFGVQFVATVAAGVELAPGLSVSGSVEGNLYDDFNTSRVSNSLLPHVRSDFMEYFTQGKNGIADLRGDYQFRIAPNIFVAARAGYLESMFAGAGGEILWRPDGARWALGADVYEVWQRDFDRLFGLQQYHIATGHVSLYYDSPWYGLNFELRAGQYLAGDRGFSLQITRRFSTGVEIGAFFTKTNVSAAQFGEGSFDKGLIIRIPLGWIAPIETQGQFAMDLRPVQRDGGQPLAGDAILYDETRATSEGELLRSQSGIAEAGGM